MVLAVFAAGCNWGYGESVERPRFAGAVLHEDGVRCVFGLHDVVYRPAEGMRAFPDGGVPRYDVDRHKIAFVDRVSGEIRVLVDRPNRDWQPGQGGFHVAGVAGEVALVSRGGQRSDYTHDHGYWKLDLRDGDLEVLSLRTAFAQLGREVARVELADADFNLVAVVRDGAGHQEIWSRADDGTLRKLATTEHYYGAHGGEIWWYEVASRAGARTDYRSGSTQLERRANFAMPRRDPVRDCQASFDGRRLLFRERAASGWSERELGVEPAKLR